MEKKILCSYEEMRQELYQMQEEDGGRWLRVRKLGFSEDGRELLLASAGNSKADCRLLIQASIHGRETLNTALAMAQLKEYLGRLAEMERQSGEKPPAQEKEFLCRNLCIHLIPMANPDGAVISQQGPDGIRNRKLRDFLWSCYQRDRREGRTIFDASAYFSRWKANARGVDLNRNFAAGWQSCQGIAQPGQKGYKGEHPYSEAETRAVGRALLHCRPACCISYHSSGNLIYWGYGSGGPERKRNGSLACAVSAATGYPLLETGGAGVEQAGCSAECAGTYGIMALTIENGKGDCPLSLEEFPAIFRANRHLWKVLAKWCLENSVYRNRPAEGEKPSAPE